MTPTPWLELLEPLRMRLKGRDHRGKKGSLRWLEAVMTEQGGRAGTVRNILYKDLGSPSEKQRMFDILAQLYAEAKLPEPSRPDELRTADAKKLLGRDKRLIYARFARDLQQNATPQMVVVGQPTTGKSILLEQLRESHSNHLFANLVHDLAPALHALAESLNISDLFEQKLALLSPTHPYALQAQHQQDILQLFAAQLNKSHKILFLRAEEKAVMSGLQLRDGQSREVSLSHWLEPFLRQLSIPYLVACSSAPPNLDYKMLRVPSRQEARSYLRQRLSDASPETIESILNKAGRNYGELSRLALLELCRAGEETETQLHNDPRLGPILSALSALSPEADPDIPLDLFEQILDKKISNLSQAEQALLEVAADGTLSPAARSLLPKASEKNKDLHLKALEYYQDKMNTFRLLHHAKAAGALERLLQQLKKTPAQLGVLPGLWQDAHDWPVDLREQLALVVVQYRSVLGDYAHPECKDALELLGNSADLGISGWANVKIAESLIDEGRYQEAESLTQTLPDLTGEAQAEALLVKAALARWQGQYETAELAVKQVLELPIPPVLADRANLWQGLVAKDSGNFELALQGLRAVQHLPLLIGRARYQEGDILLRSGYAKEGVERIREALAYLQENASSEERARVRARLGTGLKRISEYGKAAIHFRRSLKEAPDDFTKARIASEASIFESSRGRPWEALKFAAEAETFFKAGSDRPEEAAYRQRRTLYRLAVAYWVLQTGEPYRAPLRASEVSEQAVKILKDMLPQVEAYAYSADRYTSLYVDMNILLALLLPKEEAWERLKNIKDLPNAYLQQQLCLAKAGTLLRSNDAKGAAAELMAVRNLPPDPGLRASKALIEAEMMLELSQEGVAKEIITEALSLPAPFRYQLGRRWGQILLEKEKTCLAEVWIDDLGSFALPEALAMKFESLSNS